MILSSVVRRTFDKHGHIVSAVAKNEKFESKAGLGEYAKAADALAKELETPFIDLHMISEAHHNHLGADASMSYNFTEGAKRTSIPRGQAPSRISSYRN